MSTFLIGTTRRSTVGASGPVEHAMTWRRRTRTGKTFVALCGAGVYDAGMGLFDPGSDRACSQCVKRDQSTPVAGRL